MELQVHASTSGHSLEHCTKVALTYNMFVPVLPLLLTGHIRYHHSLVATISVRLEIVDLAHPMKSSMLMIHYGMAVGVALAAAVVNSTTLPGSVLLYHR